MSRRATGFTLVEIVIVVIILGIMAMIVVPRFANSADDARESALATDYNAAVRQILLYKHEHLGLLPHQKADGNSDKDNFIARMTGKTDADGTLNPSGKFGPYLLEWPSNPFMTGPAASEIKFGGDAPSSRDGSEGWYYAENTGKLYIYSTEGGADLP